jgi:hypothetical protein
MMRGEKSARGAGTRETAAAAADLLFLEKETSFRFRRVRRFRHNREGFVFRGHGNAWCACPPPRCFRRARGAGGARDHASEFAHGRARGWLARRP